MGNECVFSSISHSMRRGSKYHQMEKAWEIGSHTFSILCVFFSNYTPVLWFTSSCGKWMGFPINSISHVKMQRNPSNCESLGNWYQYFPQTMGYFLPPDSYPMVYFTTWEMHEKMQQNPPCERSGHFSTVSFSQVIPKSGDSLKESVF